MLGSIGVIAAAIVIMLTGWTLADPIVAVLIGLWVLPSTWKLLNEAGQALLQGVPAGLSVDAVRGMMVTHSSAATVHDLHIWALGSKQPVLTAHIVLKYEKQLPDIVRQSVAEALKDSFDIERATLQVDASTLLEGKVHE